MEPNESTNSDKQQVNDNIAETTTKKADIAITSPDKELEYITGMRLFLVMFTIFASTILAAIEIGIISTAIPGITDDFHRLDDVGWYGSSTFLLAGSTASLWGKLYKYLNIKYVYMTSVVLYLVGSIVAAAAPNSAAVIVGRAWQGWGAAGTLGGSVLVINYVAEPRHHPALIGLWMAVFMVATIFGPLIGGAFTSGVSWRWCFWINLPLGCPIIVLLFLFLRIPKRVQPIPATWKEILRQLDLPGFAILLTSLVCFTLALQWGGQTKSWNDGSVIATLVLAVCLTIAFFITEWLQADRAMLPLGLLMPRTTWTNALFCYISNAADFQVMFYLPIYFQSIFGQSAIMSGVNTLPFLAFFAAGALASGVLIGKTGHTQPFQLVSALLMVAGTALFYTLDVASTKGRYVGPQILFGFGFGLGSQVPMTAVQGFSRPEDVAASTGIIIMCQAISGAYFVAVAQSLFANRMVAALTNVDAAEVLRTGAAEIQSVFEGNELIAVRNAYMTGIKAVFAFALASSVLAVLIAALIPLRRLPSHGNKTDNSNVRSEGKP